MHLYYICLQKDFTKDADIYTRPAGRWLNAKARAIFCYRKTHMRNIYDCFGLMLIDSLCKDYAIIYIYNIQLKK
jgi:hypothetical protein